MNLTGLKIPYLAIFFWAALGFLILLPLFFLILAPLAGPWPFPDIIPQTWTTRGLSFLLTELPRIGLSLLWSTGFSLGAVILSLTFSWFPARFLARFQFPGQGILEALILAPALVPSITFSFGLQQTFIGFGLIDTLLGVSLALSLISFPYMFRALKIGFLALDPTYFQVAQNLGAGGWQVFWRVELPALLPALFSGAGLVFLISFSEYFLVFLIGGGIIPSFTGYLVPYLRSGDRVIGSSLTLIFLMIPVLLFLAQEWIVGGIYKKRGLIS